MDARKTALAAALSATLFAAALAEGSPAWADSAPQQLETSVLFRTSLVDFDRPTAGENDGTLSLRFGKGGTIQGYFHPVDSNAFALVTGGLDGDDIHLDIAGQSPIDGTYTSGTIVAYQYVHDLVHRFTAVRSDRPNI